MDRSLRQTICVHIGPPGRNRRTPAFQPRRVIVLPAADGCKCCWVGFPPRPLLRCNRPDDQLASSGDWQWLFRAIDRGGYKRLHFRMRQHAGRLHANEASLFARAKKQLLRIGKTSPLNKAQSDAIGTRGDRHDGICRPLSRRVADHEEIVVISHQLVGGRESLAHRLPDGANELLVCPLELLDESPELRFRIGTLITLLCSTQTSMRSMKCQVRPRFAFTSDRAVFALAAVRYNAGLCDPLRISRPTWAG